MNRLRRLVLSLTVALGAMGPVALAPSAACAADSANSAALVVDTGGSVQEYCVEISGSVSGLELIKLANKQYGLDYAFGYGGQAVCRLAGTGSNSNDCLEDDKPYFWGYWRGTGGGGWSWSNSGAGNTSVGPGDVEGWAWGSGMSGSSHPQPPNTDYEDVCNVKTDSGGGGNKDNEGASGSGGNDDDKDADNTSEDAEDKNHKHRDKRDTDAKDGNGKDEKGTDDAEDDTPKNRRHSGSEGGGDAGEGSGATSELPTPMPSGAPLAVGQAPGDGGGPPVFGLLAVLAGIGLVVGGVVATNRRGAGAHRKR